MRDKSAKATSKTRMGVQIARTCREKFNTKARGGMRIGGREMRFTTVHRRLRTVTEDTEEDGVSLTQRREEDAKGCGTEGVKGENKYGWHEQFDGLRRIRLKRGC